MKELTPDEQKRFLKVIKKMPNNEGFLLLFTLETGLRLGEALSIRFSDVKGRDNVLVRTLKQRDKIKIREIPFSKMLIPYVESYIKLFERNHNPAFNPEEMLFVTRTRRPMSARYAQHICMTAMQKANLTRKMLTPKGKVRHYGLHFHSLRHSFAKNLLRKGVPLTTVQVLMGHETIAATAVYLVPSRDELYEAIAKPNRRLRASEPKEEEPLFDPEDHKEYHEDVETKDIAQPLPSSSQPPQKSNPHPQSPSLAEPDSACTSDLESAWNHYLGNQVK